MVGGVKTARRKATYDLFRVPDTMVAEVLDGALYATPRPASPHARAEPFAAAELEIGRW